ncbi:MAG TPA: DUF4082 domain-containing protein [Alloacidobacterium sp.]|nr:DUF4082 domain-containing protein [Alloacidobacterium sp.]
MTKSRFHSLPWFSFWLTLIALACFGAQARAQCSNPANAIVAENCKTGNPDSEWDIKTGDQGDPTIQGFATDMSVNVGGTIFFKINTPSTSYKIDIYRIGYYGGLGARKITTILPSVPLPQNQPPCFTDTSVGLADCGTWAVSASWQVPTTAVSGVYIAHLLRNDASNSTYNGSHIIFVVRNDASHSDILYQTSDETWQAYNYYGAGSFYSQASPVWDLNDRSFKVSYNRPVYTRGFNQESDTWVFGPEYPMIQWLEQNGYDVSYFTGVDAARNGALIKNHKIWMDSGHDEYWSGPHRAAVQAARDAGVNLAFFSGNEVFWKTRWENSSDGSNTPYRTLVCYKETLDFAKTDPTSTWTGTWRDPSFSPPSDGGLPENALSGTAFMVNGTGPDNDGSQQIKVPAADGKMRFWRNTAVANLSANQTYTLPLGTLGYEWDEDLDNNFRPAGTFHLSTTTYNLTSDLLLDEGATYGAGTATHHMTLYRAPSGALVFSSGTIDWSWGLNNNHDNPFAFDNPAPDVNMQQATVNLFADMGVQPATLQSGLLPATASTDTTAPTSTITFPAAGATVNTGTAVTVTGTASDSGGGVVGGVEVSGDNGATWHPATGRGTWSYTWTPTVTGATKLLSRAVDDSANLETAHGINITVNPQTCPCSIWNSSSVPQSPDSGDGNSVEVGLKFRADADGNVLGVRFYKAAANTGTHVGHLWSSNGTLLATATFTGESASGWQQVNFSNPVPVTANTTYIVSYFAPNGHYSADMNAFAQAGVDDPPLHALANGVDGANAIFTYSSQPGAFPSSNYRATNYWVDVVYTSSNTYSISGTVSGVGGANATINLTGAETLSTSTDASGNYTFDGLVNGSYTVTPVNSGVTFTPASRQVTINGGVATGVNFSAVVTNPQTISGTISGTGGAGATVNLSGAATATTTADSSGNYSFTGLLNGTYNVDPSAPGILFTPGIQQVVLTGTGASGVNFSSQVCNCVSIWSPSTTPAVIDSNDGTPIEVGVAFTSSAPGQIYGLRFYKASTNTGTHVGHLWTSTGTLLGTATFSGETASGWQQVAFSSPITITPGTTYIASYFAPAGHYSADTNYFTSAVNNPPLTALVNGPTSSNGLYTYGSSGGFPTNTYASTNYWVDVLFVPAQSYTVSGTVTGAAASGATVTLSSAGTTITTNTNSSGAYSFSSVYPGTYSVSVSNTNAIFNPGTQPVTITNASVSGVNFAESPLCPCYTIWTPTTVPATVDSGDGSSVELGVRFNADFDGYVLGVRFYKAAANGGAHVGNLWSGDGSGTLLARSNFANESPSGWQQVLFTNPVPVTASTSYLASYFAPQGHYSNNNLMFDTAGVDAPPLHAPINSSNAPNGVFGYASSSTYPTNSFDATNYWVDVIYSKATTYTIAGNISGAGGAGATVTLSGAANATTTADASGNFSFSGLANGTYTVTPSKSGVTFNPASQTIVINGAHNLGVSFTASVPTYSISGTISGAPGDSVSLSGAATATTTADSSGNYTFTGLANGSYTVTPGTVGYSISPASQNVTVNNANVTGVNFSGTALTYTISGTIAGRSGVTVTLAGVSNVTTTTDASGNFAFSGVTNGSYTLTPAQTGLVFTPASLIATVQGANVTNANFTVPANCPCDTIWQPSTVPARVDDGDPNAIETGVKFRADADGYITGIRFYKASTNTGQHQGDLWSSTGTLISSAVFSGETPSGWQQVLLTNPVPVTANTTYVASYFSPAGHYSGDSQFFTPSGVNTPPLHALADGADGPNGVYAYSPSAGANFPTSTYNAGNYWVDVIYTPTTTYSVTGTISGTGGGGASVQITGTATATVTADQAGNFSFSGLPNGTYTVTPSSANAVFTPTSRSITINNGHVLGLTFTSQQSYTISGTISGPGGSGATVNLTGASTATTTANASGSYSFTGLSNGSYTVAVSKSGFVYTPASQAVTVNGASATANFSSAQTFTISGTISGAGGNGATVSLTGSSTATTTANASGVYSFTVVNGSYTVTPSKTGFRFTPASQAITVNGANQTANFTSAQLFTISGTISGTGGNGATVNLTGAATATTTANASGVYSFTVVNGSYTVTPSKTGFRFTPASQAITVNGANQTANFTSAQLFTLSGTISGAGGNGATVNLTGAATATTTANASGVYSFSVVNGSYTVTPSKANFVFTPASQAVTVNNANASANFTSTPVFTISGTISGAGGNGATVKLTGAATATVTANSSGAFTFTNVKAGSYTVTPSKGMDIYLPGSRSVTVTNSNVTGVNFSTLLNFSLIVTTNTEPTVALGQPVTFTFQVAPTHGIYPGPVSFSATGLPSWATAVFSPSTVPADAGTQTVTLTIHTKPTVAIAHPPALPGKPIQTNPIFFTMFFLPFAGAKYIRPRKGAIQPTKLGALLFAVLIAIIGAIGCGTTGGIFQGANTYSVTVKATSGNFVDSTIVSFTIKDDKLTK